MRAVLGTAQPVLTIQARNYDGSSRRLLRVPPSWTLGAEQAFLSPPHSRRSTSFGDRREFAHSVKRAKLLIENGYEVDLRKTGNPAGSIFALKNMGWSDRQEVEFRGALAHLDVGALPDALVARLAAGENPISVLAPVLQAGELPALGPGEGNAGSGAADDE